MKPVIDRKSLNYLTGFAFFIHDQFKEAIPYFEEVIKSGETGEIEYYYLSQCYLKLNDTENYVATLNRAIEDKVIAFSARLGLYYESINQKEKAIEAYEYGIKEIDDPYSKVDLAVLLNRTKDAKNNFDRCKSLCESAIESGRIELLGIGNFEIAYAYLNLNDLENARPYLEKAINAGYKHAHDLLANYYLDLDKDGNCVYQYEFFRNYSRGTPHNMIKMVKPLLETDNLEKETCRIATSILAPIVARNEPEALYWYIVGTIGEAENIESIFKIFNQIEKLKQIKIQNIIHLFANEEHFDVVKAVLDKYKDWKSVKA